MPIKFFARVNRFRGKIFLGKLHPTGGYILYTPSKKNPDVNYQNADTRICFFGPLNQTPLSVPHNFFCVVGENRGIPRTLILLAIPPYLSLFKDPYFKLLVLIYHNFSCKHRIKKIFLVSLPKCASFEKRLIPRTLNTQASF